MTRALVLFSGGQDSATCLAWALNRFEYVETVGFDYGQHHKAELDFREAFISQTAVQADTLLRLPPFKDSGEWFLPGRNILFLTMAAALAQSRSIRHIVIGVCETDHDGFRDCRDDTIKAIQVALNLGMAHQVVIHTPLMWLNKAETWTLADELGGADLVEQIRTQTLSCYVGDTETMNRWGRGCGDCPACVRRREGYAAWCDR